MPWPTARPPAYIDGDFVDADELDDVSAFFDSVVVPLSRGEEPDAYKGAKLCPT